MDHVYQANVSTTSTPAPAPGSSGHVQSEPPLPSYTPTTPGPYWYWHKTESIRNVILAAALTPDPQNLHQLRDAIEILANPPPPPTDPYFSDVVLLLHGAGAGGSSDIVDSSSHHLAMTTQGSVTVDTTEGAFSGGSLRFPTGGGNWLWSQSSVLNFDSTDFTIEMWVRLDTLTSSDGQSIFCVRNENDDTVGQTTLFVQSNGAVQYYAADDHGNHPIGFVTATGIFPALEWVFVSLTQHITGPGTGDVFLHLNGSLVGTQSGEYRSSFPAGINIGNYGFSSVDQAFVGRQQEYRATLVARYTAADYDVPTARFPDA